MTKNKNTDNPKTRGKYDEKLQVNASFLDVIKVIVKEPENKNAFGIKDKSE